MMSGTGARLAAMRRGMNGNTEGTLVRLVPSGHQKLPESGYLSKSTSRVPSVTWNYPAIP
jgi:hypothetical protein